MCYQCISLILSERKYEDAITCSDCKQSVHNKSLEDIENLCRICFKRNLAFSERITLLTCKSKHFCCSECFKSTRIRHEKIVCTECAYFFKNTSKRNCCYLCKQEKADKLHIGCSTHYLCYACKSSINISNYQQYMDCDCFYCGQSIKKLHNPVSINPASSSISMSSALGYITKATKSIFSPSCIGCSLIRSLLDLCDTHKFCQACFKFRIGSLSTGNCARCQQLKDHACRNCYQLIPCAESKFLNPRCKTYHHFYCEKCFSDTTIRGDHYFCNDCRELYQSFQTSSNACILCKNEIVSQSRNLCALHKICIACLQMLNLENIKAYSITITCNECKQIAKENFSNPYLSSAGDPSTSAISMSSRYRLNTFASTPTYNPSNAIYPGNTGQMNNSLAYINNPPQAYYPIPQVTATDLYNSPQAYQVYPNIIPQTGLNPTTTQHFNDPASFHQFSGIEGQTRTTSQRTLRTFQSAELQNYALNPQNITTGYQNYAPQSHSIAPQYQNLVPQTQSIAPQYTNYVTQTYSIPPQINAPTSTPKMMCCGLACEVMECTHPKCSNCIGMKFYATYKNFIQQLRNKNLKWLKEQKHGIGCSHVAGCFNRLCIPFEEVNQVAVLVLKEENLHEGLADYFALVFEEIPGTFSICRNCGEVKICFTNELCFWCKT